MSSTKNEPEEMNRKSDARFISSGSFFVYWKKGYLFPSFRFRYSRLKYLRRSS